MPNEYLPDLRLARGQVPKHQLIHKYGHDVDVGTTYAPLTANQLYQTPQVSNAVNLRIKAGDASNNVGQAGAWAVVIEGVDDTGNYATEVLLTNGTSTGVAGVVNFIRVYRAKISQSGSYASAIVPSHTAEIIIESTDGTEWVKIPQINNFGHSSSQIAVYSTADNVRAYLAKIELHVDGNKPVDFMLFRRGGFMQEVAPYDSMEVIDEFPAVTTSISFNRPYPELGVDGHTDIGFMAKASQSAVAVAKFTLVCVDES